MLSGIVLTEFFIYICHWKLFPMFKMAKKVLVVSVLISTTLSALADRGIGRRTKNRVSLNISTPTSLRNSIPFNLKSGLRYTGSLVTSQQFDARSTNGNTLITYQKGNTVYIIPYRQKITIPEMSQGYTGLKLIIRSHWFLFRI